MDNTNILIDVRSDTVTKPSAAMLQVMLHAKVGDDVFGEDPTVTELEEKVAAMFGHEAGLFCASGTMANQIAVKAHTQPMDEIILDKTAHIYYYETAGFAFHSGVSVKLVDGERGIMTAAQVAANIQPDFDWLPKTSLVCLEHTSNKGGGTCYTLSEIQAIRALCLQRNLKLHIDGARIFNAMVATGQQAADMGAAADSLSICFSKGLGAPVGSVLTGSKSFIRQARRVRKAFGGGMRQAGYLAAACLYALENNVGRLVIDHDHARQLADVLAELSWVKKVWSPVTNILLFEVEDTVATVAQVLDYLKENHILAVQFGPQQIRMVTHLDVTPQMVVRIGEVLKAYQPIA